MRKLVQDMMVLRDKPPPQAQTDQLFRAMWPSLESQVSEAKQQSPGQSAQRTTKEMLEELIDRVRRIERAQNWHQPRGFVASGFGARASDEAKASDDVEPPEPDRPQG